MFCVIVNMFCGSPARDKSRNEKARELIIFTVHFFPSLFVSTAITVFSPRCSEMQSFMTPCAFTIMEWYICLREKRSGVVFQVFHYV